MSQEERQQMQALLQHMDDKVESRLAAQESKLRLELTPREAISTEQLETLQLRLERLHEAGLLLDAALEALEDCVADYVEVCAALGPTVVTVETVRANGPALLVHKLIALSEAIPKDSTFARQVCRKFVK